MKRLTFNQKVLLEKDFEVDAKGYNALEVDSFFDAIIKDYEIFSTIIEEYKDKLLEHEKTIAKYSEEIKNYTNKNEILQKNIEKLKEKGVMNQDTMERLSRLEDLMMDGIESKEKK